MNDWINVKDRLPDLSPVLVYSSNSNFHVVYKYGDEWCIDECDGYFQGESIAFDYWMPLPKAPYEWISVKDSLPKNNQKVKIKSEDLWHGEGIFQNDEFVYEWVKGACFGDVTHWMPLPSHPEPPHE